MEQGRRGVRKRNKIRETEGGCTDVSLYKKGGGQHQRVKYDFSFKPFNFMFPTDFRSRL